ncbi:MAG: peptidylprolyl isomerase [Lentisphaerota bacterium]
MNSQISSVMVRATAVCAAALLMLPAMSGCGKKADDSAAAPASQPVKPQEVFAAPSVTAQAPVDPAAVVVTVDGEAITAGEVSEEVNKLAARMGRNMPPERMAQLRGQIAEQAQENLILRKLLLNQVEKAKITITEEETKTAIDQFKTSLPEGMTMEQLMMQSGMTQEEFDKNLALDLRVNKLLTEQTASATEPTDEEIKNYFDENKERFEVPESVSAKHILLAVEPTDDDAAKAAKKAKAEEIHAKLVAGADFSARAAENSDCPSNTRGGDLGSFSRGQMVKPFEDAAFTQETNAIGPVVETQFGYHIIQVTAHDAPHTYALDEIKDKIKQMLVSQKRQKAIQDYIESLRKQASIVFTEKKP